MNGSVKPRRPKATASGLRYAPARGRVAATPEVREPRVKWVTRGSVLRWVLVVALVAGIGGLTFVERAWGDEIWGGVTAAWPGGPYGLAATAGVLVPLTVAHLVMTLTRVKWPEDRARSLRWIGASVPGGALAALLLVVAFAAKRPERSSGLGCYEEGRACRLQWEYPYIWGVGWGSLLVATALLLGGLAVHRRRRAAAAHAGSPAQPLT